MHNQRASLWRAEIFSVSASRSFFCVTASSSNPNSLKHLQSSTFPAAAVEHGFLCGGWDMTVVVAKCGLKKKWSSLNIISKANIYVKNLGGTERRNKNFNESPPISTVCECTNLYSSYYRLTNFFKVLRNFPR